MKRNNNFVMRDINGETLLVPRSMHNFLNGLVVLNETGRYIWELLDNERSIDDMAVSVAEQFDVNISVARADIQVFLAEVKDLGLVEE